MLSAGFLAGGIDSTVSLSAAFKQSYDEGSDVFKNQQNLKAATWAKIETSPIKPTPQGVQIAIGMTGNESGGAMNELESFNATQSFNPQRPSILPKQIGWPFMISNAAIEMSESNKQAFGSMLDTEQQDTMSRVMSDVNRQSFGIGFGQMATVSANVVASTITVSFINVFRRSQQLDIWDALPGAGGAKQIAGVYVSAVNFETSQISFADAPIGGAAVVVNVTAGWIIVKVGVLDAAPADGKELSGLQLICDDGSVSSTFEGLSSTTNPEWLGNVIDAGGVPITNDIMMQAKNAVFVVGGGDPKFLISDVGQQREFIDQEYQKTRFEPQKLLAGTTVLKYGDMEWLVDKDYPNGEIGMYDMAYIRKYQTRDVHLLDADGKVLQRLQGKAAIGGTYIYHGNMGSWKRNAHVRIINLLEPALF